MKLVFFFLLFPVFCFSQTVHLKKGKIVYKENVKVENLSKDDKYVRAKQAILTYVKGSELGMYRDDKEKGEIASTGKIKLGSPYSIITTLLYRIKIKITDNGYKYLIDSVYLKQAERGGKTTIIPSEELVKGMDINGNVAINTEKQLNEIDMDFQQLLDLIKNEITGVKN